jgi:hypothetical protein
MKEEKYKPRIADEMLRKKLRRIGAVLVQGPKWCGKTTTSEQVAKSIVYIADPSKQKAYLNMAELNASMLLTGETPRLIDEWQLAPKIWDAVRFEVDHRGEEGLFILTGSAVPPSMDEIHHTGTGRISRLTMRPMSLFESGESNGSVSLEWLFSQPENQPNGIANISINDLAFLICRGGWPNSTTKQNQEDALALAFDYFDAVAESDISRVDGVKRNPDKVKLFLRSYARHQGAQASIEIVKQDMNSLEDSSISENSIISYIDALKKIFVIEDMAAWNPNLRSKTAIRTSETRYFVDPSIATAALGLGPSDLLNDLNTMGLFFETLAVRDLRVYADALDGKVYHYRDKTGLECDAVLHLRNGHYGLIEIKLGGDKLIEEGVKTLTDLSKKIDTTKMPNPSFLMVLTGIGDYAYRRADGVYVVPIGCLRV